MNRQGRRARRPGIRGAALGAVLVAGLLVGCGTSTATLESETAGLLQTSVLSVSTAAAAGDYAAAMHALEALKAVLAVATEEDRLSAGRASDIQSAIALVEADLATLLAATTPTPRPTPSATPRTTEPVDPPSPEPDLPDPTPSSPEPTPPAPTEPKPTERPQPEPTPTPEPTPEPTEPATPEPTPLPTPDPEPDAEFREAPAEDSGPESPVEG